MLGEGDGAYVRVRDGALDDTDDGHAVKIRG
jgi:hypothetical protein